MHVFVHFIDKKQHCNIEFYACRLTYIGKPIEEIGVLPSKVYGHNIAFSLHALCYKSLLPLQITYLSVYATRAYTCRKHKHMSVALEPCLYHCGETTALTTGLVYRYTHGGKSREIHQQIVDKISETPVVMTTDNGTERHSVDTAERMIAHKGIKSAVCLLYTSDAADEY